MSNVQRRSKLTCDAQIRLLLPKQWLSELNSLAASRFISRLALIRFYLRTMMDKDLESLADHLEQREQLNRTKAKLDAYLQRFDE